MNVLYWITNRSRQFKSFIGNRIGEIHQATNSCQWRKVPTSENPADFISRGLSVKDLAQSNTWWNGPNFLHLMETEWPVLKISDKKTDVGDVEEKSPLSLNYHVREDKSLATTDEARRLNPKRFSEWLRLVRVSSWVHRFLYNCRENNRKLTGLLGPDELRDSELRLIKQAQFEEFKAELTALRSNRNIATDSKILSLSPTLDEDGLLRADTRLKYAEFIPLDVRCPIILPRNNSVTALLVRHYYKQNNNWGTNQTLTALSTRYWIVHAREEIRDVEKACIQW